MVFADTTLFPATAARLLRADLDFKLPASRGRSQDGGCLASCEENPLVELRAAMKKLSYIGRDGLGEAEAQEIWMQLRCALREIFSGNASRLSFEELYRFAYTLVLHRRGNFLYSSVKECICELLEESGRVMGDLRGDAFGQAFLRLWETHKNSMGLTRDIMMYLDRNFIPSHRLRPVYTMGMDLFCTEIVMKTRINTALKDFLRSALNAERMGEAPNPNVYSVVSVLVELQQQTKLSAYTSEFEGPFLADADAFHEREASRAASQLSAPLFLRRADELIVAEATRVERFFAKETLPKLLFLLHKHWVRSHFKSVIHNSRCGADALIAKASPPGFVTAASQDRESSSPWAEGRQSDASCVQTLYQMYRLFEREEEAVEELRQVLDRRLTQEGQALLSDPEVLTSAVRFTEGFVYMRKKFNFLIQEAFGGNALMTNTVKRAFEGFFAAEPNSSTLLCEYLDDIFQMSDRKQQQESLRDVAGLFCFVKDKDAFNLVYRRKLGARLLRRCSYLPAEQFFVSLLKEECGEQYTVKLELMFKELAQAESLFAEFAALSAGHSRCSGVRQQWLCDFSRREGACASSVDSRRAEEGVLCAMQVEAGDLTDAGGGGSGGRPLSSDYLASGGSVGFSRGGVGAVAQGGRQGRACVVGVEEETDEATSSSSARQSSQCDPAFECLVLSKPTWSPALQVAPSHGDEGTPAETEANDYEGTLLDLLLLPPALKLQVEAFTTFYLNKHANQLLSFSLYKLFNAHPRVTAKGAAEALGIHEREAIRFLEALTEGEMPMEASIVRTLKQCNTLSHDDLRRAVTKRLAPYFPVSSDEFAKTILALIEKEYIKESEDHPCIYKYNS